MSLNELISEKRQVIEGLWLDSIIETYPSDSNNFFKNKKDKFQNPVGEAMRKQAVGLLTALLANTSDQEITLLLEEFIKMRAVQEFQPSKAVGYILSLKQVVRFVVLKEVSPAVYDTELAEFEKRIDQLLLIAFDVYSQVREKLYSIRAEELKRRSYMALRRFGSESDSQEKENAGN